ncbi:hypothetical protein H9Q72_007244 [Fusarium xylarioides]|uniref:Uncharacterized protein n=1 Tax=Fusarium xylarioides TaxID=221167 RepID=A0A9P7L4Y8_9HYPO|nr:hypothetical protein H9Q72_007244 [Fusarium xylarioides]
MHGISRQQTLTTVMPVPFDESVSLFHIPNDTRKIGQPRPGTLVLPAVYTSRGKLHRLDFEYGVMTYLEVELDVSRLNEIHNQLWMVGKPMPGRPLHQHLVYGRKIVCAEQADLHLLWDDYRLFVKPCPDYLLSFDFWERYLCSGDDSLWAIAAGMVQSYTWLIQDKSDWKIAQTEGILSECITWERWTAFVCSFTDHLEASDLDVNPRFKYGNLRLPRIQWIWRFRSQTGGVHASVNGYLNPYSSYRHFFKQMVAPITVATVYFALILAAMQVGLATTMLQDSDAFQSASMCFTVLAIVGYCWPDRGGCSAGSWGNGLCIHLEPVSCDEVKEDRKVGIQDDRQRRGVE